VMIVLPMLTRTRSTAFRMTCGTNLSGIGKAMLIYANDYEDELPHAGTRITSWAARTPDWRATDRFSAFGIGREDAAGRASISASLYLLVKYEEADPKSFLCTDDKQATEFKPSRYGARGELIDFWDFGPNPPKHVSYSYHMPYSQYRLTTSSPPGLAVAADRNPWTDSPFVKARDFSKFRPGVSPNNGTVEQYRAGNSSSHKGDGQNVMFLDSHVEFAKWPNCGLEEDNIYTFWDGDNKYRGCPPTLGSEPADPNDSLLVNDPGVPPR